MRTALGVRVDSGVAHRSKRAIWCSTVANVPTAGLSVEQVEQLAIFDDGEPSESAPVVVLREGECSPRSSKCTAPDRARQAGRRGRRAAEHWVPYGDGDALVIEIADVPDDLGRSLAVTIARARTAKVPTGIVLDLRGNGGGSTDGANAALGHLLAGGAPLSDASPRRRHRDRARPRAAGDRSLAPGRWRRWSTATPRAPRK